MQDDPKTASAPAAPPPKPPESLVRQFAIGSLDVVVGGSTVDGWAWNEFAPSRPVQVSLHIDGERAAIITPQNFRADLAAAGIAHGCFAFSWNIPALYRDGQPHEVRAYITDFQEEIPKSPLTFTLGPDAEDGDQAGAPPFVNPNFDIWTSGLSGAYAGQKSEIAPGLAIAFDEPEGAGQFFVTAPQFPTLAITPYYGIRLVNTGTAPCALHHRLSERARRSLANGLVLSQEISLAGASEPVFQRMVSISLVQQVRDGFKRLRRIVRGRVFRRPTLLTFTLKLTAEEQTLLAARALFLATSVENAATFQIYAPQIVRNHTNPPAGLVGFEDRRLTEAFEACAALAATNGQAAAYAKLLDPAIPQHPVRTAPKPAAATSVLDQMRTPFTQIIVPAYNGDAIVIDCLRSVQAGTHSPFQCLVINDGSRRHTSDMLRAFAASDPRFILYDREENRGYTKSVNEAIKLAGAEWVVILNSDTVVSRDWLHRLHNAALSHPEIGMVGPLSNAASYQSLPELRNPDGSWSKNDFIKPGDVDRVQTLLDALGKRDYPSLPLLNGFCTLIARKVFETCGLFDEDAFPTGYGEETDLCIRATKAGFRLVVADDCFVYHRKSVSFGVTGRKALSKAGGNEVLNKHLGLVLPELEEMMQNNPVLARIRESMVDLHADIRAG